MITLKELRNSGYKNQGNDIWIKASGLYPNIMVVLLGLHKVMGISYDKLKTKCNVLVTLDHETKNYYTANNIQELILIERGM